MTIELPHDYISPSQVAMYLRCPKQYEFRYIEGLKRPPGVALTEGKSHHVALEMNNTQKIESHEDLPTKQIVECFQDTFSDQSKGIEEWEDETKDTVIERGTGLLNIYMKEMAPEIQPVAAEEQFTIPLQINDEAVDVNGFIDLEQEGPVVSDYKVVKRAKSEADAADDLQLAIYAAATGATRTEFICLCKAKTPKVVTAGVPVTEGQTLWAAEVIRGVVKAISAGVFPLRNPAGWECSERFCGYWHICRGK